MQRIGLAGFGFIGKTHLEAYRKIKDAEVTAICTSTAVGLEEVFDGTVLADYDALLEREDIDVIDICVPTFLHEEYVIKAARAKKHIICEKPLALTSEAAERIMEVVREEGVQLFVGHVLRFWPEYRLIKEYAESDRLGDVEFIHAQRLGTLPTWSDWFQYPEKSGGALFDLHIHDIDFVYNLLGEVESVYAAGKQNKYGAWNHVMTTLTFKSGAKAFVEASHRMPSSFPFTAAIRVQSQQEVMDYKLIAGENIEQISNRQFVYYADNACTSLQVEEEEAFQTELSYFIDCLENNKENLVIPLDDVLYVIGLMQEIEKSLITGSEIKVL